MRPIARFPEDIGKEVQINETVTEILKVHLCDTNGCANESAVVLPTGVDEYGLELTYMCQTCFDVATAAYQEFLSAKDILPRPGIFFVAEFKPRLVETKIVDGETVFVLRFERFFEVFDCEHEATKGFRKFIDTLLAPMPDTGIVKVVFDEDKGPFRDLLGVQEVRNKKQLKNAKRKSFKRPKEPAFADAQEALPILKFNENSPDVEL